MYQYRHIIRILLAFSVFFVAYMAISHASTDITKPTFMVDIGAMDPIKRDASASTGGGIATLQVVLAKLTGLFLFIIPVIAAVSLIIAGYFYIFSAGDSEKASKAKIIIKWNIIAIILGFLSLGIINLIAAVFTPTP